MEGIGYDFIPTVLDRDIVDKWMKCEDESTFIMARRLIREEGLLCGGSSGAAMAAAVEAASVLKEGQRCVVILPDSIRNYMSKHLSNDWMWKHGFVSSSHGVGTPEHTLTDTPWASKTVSDLTITTPFTVSPEVSCREVIDILKGEGFDQLPVVSPDGEILGVVTEGNISAKLVAGRCSPDDPVSKVLYRQFRKVSLSTPLSELARIFDKDHFALVVTSQRCFTGAGSAPTERAVIAGVVSRIDLLSFIMGSSKAPGSRPPSPLA